MRGVFELNWCYDDSADGERREHGHDARRPSPRVRPRRALAITVYRERWPQLRHSRPQRLPLPRLDHEDLGRMAPSTSATSRAPTTAEQWSTSYRCRYSAARLARRSRRRNKARPSQFVRCTAIRTWGSAGRACAARRVGRAVSERETAARPQDSDRSSGVGRASLLASAVIHKGSGLPTWRRSGQRYRVAVRKALSRMAMSLGPSTLIPSARRAAA